MVEDTKKRRRLLVTDMKGTEKIESESADTAQLWDSMTKSRVLVNPSCYIGFPLVRKYNKRLQSRSLNIESASREDEYTPEP